jgi:hypothetical protein
LHFFLNVPNEPDANRRTQMTDAVAADKPFENGFAAPATVI